MIARYASADVERISAVTSGVKEIREAIERARQNRNAGRRTILFVDEVHRFNKSQQDAFLPHIEDGTITFIGATTENPSFELNSALLSRARVYLLKSLTTDDIERVLDQAMNDKTRGYGGQDIILPDETRRAIAELVNGDARRALNTLEMMADMAESDDSGKRVLKAELLTEIAGERSARFDNKGDRFYDLISALHKSVRGKRTRCSTTGTRGSSPPAAIRCTLPAAVWRLPRKMSATPTRGRCRSLFRRGIALPASGPAEGERAIAGAIVYLACAPKSNAVYTAFKAALADARDRPDYDVPVHLRNAPTKLMKEMGYGQEYRYAHDEPNAYAAGEQYFRRKWRKRAIITRQTGGLRAKLAKSSPGSLNRIKIAR